MRRPSDWLLGQLPMGMLEDDFFVRFVSIFQAVATSLMEDADNLDNIVDVDVAPPEVVRWLGSWIGIESIDSSLDVGIQRRIVRETGPILAWRGTKRGLVGFLELLTGDEVEVRDNGGVFGEGEAPSDQPMVWMRVRSTGWLSDADFIALVRDEVPANTHFELRVDDRVIWPRSIEPTPEVV